ncbi:tail fiber assembly protein [Salmonella enterica]|nr:phage tail fiber protein [Salmonella enterica subsp. enterica serovar Heidelberg str. 82-2052]ESG39813.1 phage tail fiber protein [Salmonella enterica subsp. enterica serovar Meleagridis str. 0047]ESH11790.1 putative bacteriophage tail fiber protein [Salmonella enterica subsp. enterica serovar Derby str. 626]EYH52349.1 putative bacteriophage tail fiber protein [Salmonella enterica subsp. enterica serovar Heidelberg str. SARA37]
MYGKERKYCECIVTDDEIKRLEAWKRYGVLVNQVNTASPVWPEQPA